MTYVLGRRERENKLLLRGDCEGRLAIWNILDVNDNSTKLVRQESFENLPGELAMNNVMHCWVNNMAVSRKMMAVDYFPRGWLISMGLMWHVKVIHLWTVYILLILVVLQPKCITSLQEEWAKVDPPPEGIIDHLVGFFVDLCKLTCGSAFDCLAELLYMSETINRCNFLSIIICWLLVVNDETSYGG